MWQQRIFTFAGLLAALLLTYTAVSSVVGLSTSEKPTPKGYFEIPPFASLVECNAFFSHEILRIKNDMAAHHTKADLPAMHRNYRRLHRLVRQVGRRDGIPPATQTESLRNRVRSYNDAPGTGTSPALSKKCTAMANMPIARERYSQRIVGR